MTRVMQDLTLALGTILAFYFLAGAMLGSPQAFTVSPLVFVCLIKSKWVIVGILSAMTRLPTHAEIMATAGFTTF
ncbi:hypothetical protein HDU90_004215 [Geranomyces variabilis]|nr:hypothetical protein HDU90_004215 [Geranomyces variabilis]